MYYMFKVNKLSAGFINITNALDNVKHQAEYKINISRLHAYQLECLNGHSSGKAAVECEGMHNNVAQGDVVDVYMWEWHLNSRQKSFR